MNRAVPNFNRISFDSNCGNCGHEQKCKIDWVNFNKGKYKKHPEDKCDSYSGWIECDKCKAVMHILFRVVITTYDNHQERDEQANKLNPNDPDQLKKISKMVNGNQSLI